MKHPPIRTLGIIGDVHAEHERLERALDFLKGRVDVIACTGDVVDGRGNPDHAAALLMEYGVQTVRGNHDRWLVEEKARHVPEAHLLGALDPGTVAFLRQLPPQVTLETSAGALLLCHGILDNDLKKVWPGTERMGIERSAQFDRLIRRGRFRFVINGHMHFRTIMHFEGLTLINAGTLKGERWPGFSVIDFDARQIDGFEFEGDEVKVTPTATLPLDPLPHHTVWANTQAFSGGWSPVRLFRA